MKLSLLALIFLLILSVNSKSQIQSDTSDALWSIVMPIVESIDIDMGQCIINTYKDSVVLGFVSNTGSWSFSVDSIYFRGADAGFFKILSGIPKYELLPTDGKNTEFSFNPTAVRQYQAEIVIITQADTLVRNIRGEGVDPQLQVITKLLDFGQVELGNDKFFLDTALIKNISGVDITINDVVQLGPDKTQFEILSGGGSFVLISNDQRKLNIRFKPIYGGRTSGQIGFLYNGIGSPVIAQLYGQGIGGVVYIANDSAYPGQEKSLKLIMDKVKPDGIAAIAPNFEARIRFQKTILYPKSGADFSFSGDSIYVKIKGKIGSTLELSNIPIIAGLGEVEETAVDIVDMKLLDDFGNQVEYDFEKASGIFKILGICSNGGRRLIDANVKVGLMKIVPNPTTDNIELDINLTESGYTDMSIYNTLGEKVKSILGEEISKFGSRKLSVSLSEFTAGQYFIILKTPTYIENKNLFIIK